MPISAEQWNEKVYQDHPWLKSVLDGLHPNWFGFDARRHDRLEKIRFGRVDRKLLLLTPQSNTYTEAVSDLQKVVIVSATGTVLTEVRCEKYDFRDEKTDGEMIGEAYARVTKPEDGEWVILGETDYESSRIFLFRLGDFDITSWVRDYKQRRDRAVEAAQQSGDTTVMQPVTNLHLYYDLFYSNRAPIEIDRIPGEFVARFLRKSEHDPDVWSKAEVIYSGGWSDKVPRTPEWILLPVPGEPFFCRLLQRHAEGNVIAPDKTSWRDYGVVQPNGGLRNLLRSVSNDPNGLSLVWMGVPVGDLSDDDIATQPCGCHACDDGVQPGHFACRTPSTRMLDAEKLGQVERYLESNFGSRWYWRRVRKEA